MLQGRSEKSFGHIKCFNIPLQEDGGEVRIDIDILTEGINLIAIRDRLVNPAPVHITFPEN